MTFSGEVQFRSSNAGVDKSFGEANLLRINPKRVELLLAKTGWSKLEPGSLNLKVDCSVVPRLAEIRELYFEEPTLIKYPDGTSRIPLERGGYLYYKALLSTGSGEQRVLVRRGRTVPLLRIVEAYAEVSLVEKFDLGEHDVVQVAVKDACDKRFGEDDLAHDIAAMKRWAKSTPVVEKVWIFGSRVSGKKGNPDDLDVAVQHGALPGDTSAFTTAIGEMAKWRAQVQAICRLKIDLQSHIPGESTVIEAALIEASKLIYVKDRSANS